MKPEQQRIKIAEACEWKGERFDHIKQRLTSDLNAMHAAETILRKDPVVWQRYVDTLNETLSLDDAVFATASQRAEAFLRTLGLWED